MIDPDKLDAIAKRAWHAALLTRIEMPYGYSVQLFDKLLKETQDR